MQKTPSIKPAVLFADDEEALRLLFKLTVEAKLKDLIDFLVASSGQEALTIIENTRDRLIAVLTDLGFGEGPNGNVVAKAALHQGIQHVAICTGSGAELICDDIQNRITLIEKPFDMQKLLNFCMQAVQSST